MKLSYSVTPASVFTYRPESCNVLDPNPIVVPSKVKDWFASKPAADAARSISEYPIFKSIAEFSLVEKLGSS